MNFSEEMKSVLDSASKLCSEYNSGEIKPEYFILGVINTKEKTHQMLSNCNIDTDGIYSILERVIISNELTPRVRNFKDKPISKELSGIFELSNIQVEKLNDKELNPYHVILTLLASEKETAIKTIFNKSGLYYSNFFKEIAEKKFFPENNLKTVISSKNKINSRLKDLNTPAINSFCKNYNELAINGKFEPVIARSNEIKRITQILTRKKKNNIIIVGEGGVGKTTLIEGLAYDIVNGNAPESISNKIILGMDVTAMVSGTKYRGQFEERAKALVNDLSKIKDVILFIDEIHMITGAGAAGDGIDFSNIIKPSLSNGEIQVIGTTTNDEYRTKIEKDSALVRRFQKIQLEEPSVEDSITILMNIKQYYEEFHKVKYSKKAIETCVKLSKRYITDRLLPDSAIDVMDETASKFRVTAKNKTSKLDKLESKLEILTNEKTKLIESQDFDKIDDLIPQIEELVNKINQEKDKKESKSNEDSYKDISEEEIKNVISEITQIPISKISDDENKKLIELENVLNSKVIGQEKAINKIVQAIKRSRVGIKDPNKPYYSVMFLGPTGVGKTLIAKQIAEEIFGSKDSMIRVDMSEYMEKHSVSKLIGAPPGYVGYGEGGQLTEAVRRKPFSVILLDEIEKAHVDVFNVFLQILDDGFITDTLGRKVNFKNTIIIMTSNVGAKEAGSAPKMVGFTSSNTNLQDVEEKRKMTIIMKELKNKFRPEFINRIDDIVCFNSLTKDNLKIIINLELDKLMKRLKDNNMKIKTISDDVVNFLIEKGTNIELGARPLYRAIQDHIENKLADFILLNPKIKEFTITLDKENNNIIVE